MGVDTKHPDYVHWFPKWEDCRTWYEGEDSVKKKGTRFLPQPSAATDEEYNSYKDRAFFYGVIEETINGLSGAVFRKNITNEIPPKLEYIVDSADDEMNGLEHFARMVLEEGILTGRVGILVDRPAEENGTPYMTMFKAEDIINWRHNSKDGTTLVVVRESYYDEDSSDKYDHVEMTRYRELTLVDGLYVQNVYEVDSKEQPSSTPTATYEPTFMGKRLDYIPFVFINSRTIVPDVEKPPLLQLVRKNTEHYRVSADYSNSLYHAGQPLLVGKGMDEDSINKLKIGSSHAIMLGSTEASLGYVEVSGGGINPNKDRCDDIKMEMAVLGAKLLEGQRIGVEAAETASLRQNAEMSKLGHIVYSISNGLTKALQYIAKWEGVDETKVKCELNKDFASVKIDSALIGQLSTLVDKEQLSFDTFLYNLSVGEILPPGKTIEEEKGDIETQPPVSATKAASQAASIAQAELVTKQATDAINAPPANEQTGNENEENQ